jgi:hypothetical protein
MPRLKRKLEEACTTCGHFHDVRSRVRASGRRRVLVGPIDGARCPGGCLLAFPRFSPLSLSKPPPPPKHTHATHKQYEGGEPCSICGHTLARASTPTASLPAAARPGRVGPALWFGSYEVGARPNLLTSLGVTRVVSLVPGDGGALYPHSLAYTLLPPDEPDLAHAVAVIGEKREKERERDERGRGAEPHHLKNTLTLTPTPHL